MAKSRSVFFLSLLIYTRNGAPGCLFAHPTIPPAALTFAAATREDAFIDVDLTDGSVKFIDADELIKFDLEDPTQRLSFFTINPWDIADYDETAQSFSFRQDEVEEAIKNALSLQAEFTEA